jgi:hypothetical protein
MVEPSAREAKAGAYVRSFEIRKLLQNLLGSKATGQ